MPGNTFATRDVHWLVHWNGPPFVSIVALCAAAFVRAALVSLTRWGDVLARLEASDELPIVELTAK
eukprot:6268671-Alexandrium_andersonii.AAC.1